MANLGPREPTGQLCLGANMQTREGSGGEK